MADKKVSQLTALTSTASVDLLYVVDDPNGTPLSKKMTIKNFFGAVPSNTVFSARMRATGNVTVTCSNTVLISNVHFVGSGKTRVNNMIMTLKSNPASNNATTAGYSTGSIFFSNTHIYIAVNATTLKRIALSTFT